MHFLTGFKPTGEIHLGNYIGAIRPALNLNAPGIFCVADYHALTTIQDASILRSNTLKMCAALIALGCNSPGRFIYRQSKVPQVQELSWILACLAPMGLMNRGHAVKAAKDGNAQINLGTFNYPVLMAADILLCGNIDSIPVGKDQHQHVQIAQILAEKINLRANKKLLKVPQAVIDHTEVVPGIDGYKMSKSNNNTIPLFLNSSDMKKRVFSIKTSSTPREEPMNPDECTVFKLYQHLATSEQISQMRDNYASSNYGYGNAKEDLLAVINNVIETKFSRYQELINNPQLMEDILLSHEEAISLKAAVTLKNVRYIMGL